MKRKSIAEISDLKFGIEDIDNDEDGYTENDGDCDDTDPTIYPGAEEICGDGIDQDCDGEDLECTVLGDLDGDGAITADDYTAFRGTLGKCSGDDAVYRQCGL